MNNTKGLSCSSFNADSSETVAYNNPLFPAYIRYGLLSSYPDYSAISHWHNDLEFIYVIKGHMTYNVNGVLTELTEQTGILVNSRQLHYGFSSQRSECEFICILLSPDLLRGNEWFYTNYVESITNNPSFPFVYLDQTTWKGDILQLIQNMYDYFDEAVASSYFRIMSDFLSICDLVFQNIQITPVPQKETSDLAFLRGMITYIEEHYMEHLSLMDIAGSENISKSKCSALFQQYLCNSPMIYLTKYRLRKSLAPLLQSDQSITDIAYETGFCSASYYCETFHKYYQTSPFNYRKQQTIPTSK